MDELLLASQARILDRFKREPTYAKARLAAFAELKLSAPLVGSYRILDPDLATWLDPVEHGWNTEKPPLLWYGSALAAHMHVGLGACPLTLPLMRAANYYGDYALALELGSTYLATKVTNKRNEIRKQMAKAHKNSGRFDAARSVYRDLLAELPSTGHRADVAYVIMLYAKLCNEFQQRQGYHVAFHRFSYERIVSVSSALPPSNGYTRWIAICTDSYAKAIYAMNPLEGERLFATALVAAAEFPDALVRIAAHQQSARLQRLFATATVDDAEAFDAPMEAFVATIEKARSLQNTRAVYVREVQCLYLQRLLADWRRERQLPVSRDADIMVKMRAESIRAGASRLCDWKTSALAAYEQAMWAKLTGDPSNPKVCRAIAEHLTIAKNALTGSGDLVAHIYHNILVNLGEGFIGLKEWTIAAESYKEAYEYCKMLAQAVRKDEEEVATALREAPKELPPELAILTPQERLALKQELMLDYKVLTERMIEIGERIQSLQLEQIITTTRQSKELSRAFKYHTISERVRQLRDAAAGNREVIAVLDELANQLAEWLRQEPALFQKSRFDLRKELGDAIATSLAFREYRHRIRLSNENTGPLMVQFNRFVVRSALDSLIANVVEAARRGGIRGFRIEIDLYAEGGIAKLAVRDNTGGEDQLREAIVQLNGSRSATRVPPGGRGLGLVLIREMIQELTGLREAWEVRHGQGGAEKVLIIPLAYVLGS